MLNRATIMGRLVADPIYRTTRSNIPVANFSLAVERDYINRETQERDVDFINVTAWRGLADWAARYLTKGQTVTVDGRIESRPWIDKDGSKRHAVGVTAENIYFGGPRRSEAPSGEVAPHEDSGSGECEAAAYQGEAYPAEEAALPWEEGGDNDVPGL